MKMGPLDAADSSIVTGWLQEDKNPPKVRCGFQLNPMPKPPEWASQGPHRTSRITASNLL